MSTKSTIQLIEVPSLGTRKIQTLHGVVEDPYWEEDTELIGLVKKLLRETGVTHSDIARALGISTLNVFMLKHGQLTCDIAEFKRRTGYDDKTQ